MSNIDGCNDLGIERPSDVDAGLSDSISPCKKIGERSLFPLSSEPDTPVDDLFHTVISLEARISSLEEADSNHLSAIQEWRELLCLVTRTGLLLLNKFDAGDVNEETPYSELKLSTLAASAQISSIASSLSTDCSAGDNTTGQSSICPVTEPSREPSGLMEMIETIRDFQSVHDESRSMIDSEAIRLEGLLQSDVDRLFDSILSDSLERVRNGQVAFLLESYPDEIDAIRKTNSMRWLNDVLKWQVLDLNIQIQKRKEATSLIHSVKLKKELMHGIIRSKLQQSASLKKLESGNAGLDRIIENFCRVASSSLPTASSTPPVVAVKMMQSPAAKIDDAALSKENCDIKAVGY